MAGTGSSCGRSKIQEKFESEIVDLQRQAKQNVGFALTLGEALFDTGKNDLKVGTYKTIEKLAYFLPVDFRFPPGVFFIDPSHQT